MTAANRKRYLRRSGRRLYGIVDGNINRAGYLQGGAMTLDDDDDDELANGQEEAQHA